jgi:glycosyltransferase involved in cell wall biosynthesis
MKIFMITSVPMTPPWDQGDKNLAYTLTRALPDIRYKVLTQRNGPHPTGSNLIAEPLYWSRKPSLAQKAYVFSHLLTQGTFLARNNGSSKVDLYHLIYRPYLLSSSLFHWLPDFHNIPTIHTIPATSMPHQIKRELFFARRNVVLSQYGYKRLTDLGLDDVVYIPPGIPVDEWEISAEKSARYKKHLELEGHPVVLFPGHYGAGMGSDMMLQAMPQLVSMVPQVIVIFACRHRSADDWQKEHALKDKLTQLGLINSARFYTTHADMKSLISASDLVALPLTSLKNKLDIPTTLLEFMAMGKPIVITDMPPMNEILISETGGSTEVGLAIPPGNPEALAQSLIHLTQDIVLRQRLGRCGHELVRDRYNIVEVAKKYESLYQELTH